MGRTEELTAILNSDSTGNADVWKFAPVVGQALRLPTSATDAVALQNIICDIISSVVILIFVNFWIGTSGFQYTEWKGNFYPEDLPTAQMLPFYAERFSTTEINYTFHRIPAPKTIENWKTLTPENFRFALKAPQKITHWSKLRDCADTLEYFLKVAGGLGERLGPVLFQLPPTFKKDADVLNSFLRELPDMRAAFEFRHESWFDDDIFELLKSRNIALCIADTDTHELRRRKLLPITGISGFAAKIIKRRTSNVGQNSPANKNRIGKTLSSISNTKRAASGRSSRHR